MNWESPGSIPGLAFAFSSYSTLVNDLWENQIWREHSNYSVTQSENKTWETNTVFHSE